MSAIRIVLNVGSLALIAVLGWLVVRIGLGVAQPESLYEPEPIIAPIQTASAGTAAKTYDFSTDPFSFGEVVIVPQELLEDAPETTLNLKLIGIVSESSAVFRLADGKDKTVKLGEDVMNGVTLTGTTKEFVTLDVNGETQKLTLERVKLGENDNAPKILRAAPEAVTVGTAKAQTRKPKARAAVPTRADAENLLSQVTISPSREGFRINAKSGADLSKFNLKSGDILTRVGPVVLNSGKPNIKELRDLLSSGAAQDYEVIRNGSPVTIRIGQ